MIEEKEIWRDIFGYEGLYQISNLGNVKSLNYRRTGKEKILKPAKNSSGYLNIILCKNGTNKSMLVHRLVAQAFVQNDSIFNNEVNHKNECKTDNRACNLEFCNAKYNSNYGTRNEIMGKTISKVNKNNNNRSKKVLCVETNVIYLSTYEVQRKLGFRNQGISMCCNGKLNTCGGYHWMYVD